jgi:hypothetical protein
VPADKPLTIPVVAPTVPTAVLLLLHVPPDTELVWVIVLPTQTLLLPDIVAFGTGVTFTVAIVLVSEPPEHGPDAAHDIVQ